MRGKIIQKGTPNPALGLMVKTSDGNEYPMQPYRSDLLPDTKVEGHIEAGFFHVKECVYK